MDVFTRGLSNHDLNFLLRNEIGFQGCYMRTEKLPRHGSFILNLDRAESPGTHWVLVHLELKVYYDSYGLSPPLELKKYQLTYNTVQHQKARSNLCGLYCCFVLKMLNRGYSFYDICYNFIKFYYKNKNDKQLLDLLCEMQEKD